MGNDLQFLLLASGAMLAGSGLYLVLLAPWW
jgi:hypothetical protein